MRDSKSNIIDDCDEKSSALMPRRCFGDRWSQSRLAAWAANPQRRPGGKPHRHATGFQSRVDARRLLAGTNTYDNEGELST